MAALRGLMPNIGGPRESRRRVLLSVVFSVMMYGAPTWGADMALCRIGLKVLAAVQRLATIVSVCANRTVSYDAVAVIACTISIVLMTQERFASFEARRTGWLMENGDRGSPRLDGPAEAALAHDAQALRSRVLAKLARDTLYGKSTIPICED